jgi:outer membrane protein W
MHTSKNLRSPIALLLAVGSIALAATGAQAQEESGEYDWKFFVGGAYIMPLSDSEIDGDTVEASSEFGLELGVEWKFSDRFGFEFAYTDATQDVEVSGTAFGEIDFNPMNLTFNFHLIDRNAFNWYLGPTVSMIDWGDLEVPGFGSESIESETGYGVSTGIAIGLGQTFAIQFGARYIQASAEDSFGDEVDVDPLFASVGVAFRF